MRTSAGELTCTTLINATGGLSAPKLPDIEGIDTFAGHLFHTAEWDHSVDLKGLRVAVIGTGASAIQVIPAIRPTVGHLDVYQRSAPVGAAQGRPRVHRQGEAAVPPVPAGAEGPAGPACTGSTRPLVPGITRQQRLNAPVERLGRMNLALGVKDPALRERLRPTFAVFCKRILLSDDYYPAMAADNVEVVTDPIARITPTGVVTADGVERPVDVLVVATGFHATDPRSPTWSAGATAGRWPRPGRRPAWRRTRARPCTASPTCSRRWAPTPARATRRCSLYIEAATGYIRDAMRTMRRRRLGAIEPKAAAQARWNADLQRRMERTVWTRGGCSSWYLDEHGRNTILWPRTTVAFRRAMKEFDLAAYDVRSRRDEVVRRAGGRDHRRGLGHRAGAGRRPGRSRRAARALGRRRRGAGRDGRPRQGGRGARGAQRRRRRGVRPAVDAWAATSSASSDGSTCWSTTRASR